jgi:hypothetical protein
MALRAKPSQTASPETEQVAMSLATLHGHTVREGSRAKHSVDMHLFQELVRPHRLGRTTPEIARMLCMGHIMQASHAKALAA